MKLIGIVGRTYYNKDNQKIIQLNEDLRRVFTSYEDVVTTLLLPTLDEYYVDLSMGSDVLKDVDKKKLDFILDKCDAFIIPGGTFWWRFDEYVLSYALKNKKPVLAICLGFQALCSMYAHNRVRFDMTEKLADNIHYQEPDTYAHEVMISKDSQLYKILGEEKFSVNSIHHDYIKKDVTDLVVVAYSDDDVIEAVEVSNHPFAIGLQWHPEYLKDEHSKKIMDAFIRSI